MHNHLIRDYVENKTVKIMVVRSEENMADTFTKNLSKYPFKSLAPRYVHREQYLKNSLSLFQSPGSKASHVTDEGC